MLVELRIENHRSIREEQVLTLEAASLGDAEDPRARKMSGHKRRLLTAAALYGANASGKSNVLMAFDFMSEAVLFSHRGWPPEAGVPRDPFAWGPQTAEPSLFEVTLIEEGVRYQYGFTATDERFLEEWLFAWPRGRKQVWFQRDCDEFSFGENLHGENRLVEQVTRPNALFLSAAAQLRHKQLTSVYRWFNRLRSLHVPGRHPSRRVPFASRGSRLRRVFFAGPGPQLLLFGENEAAMSRLEAMRSLLQAADVGILDIKLEETDDSSDWRDHRSQRVLIRHRSRGLEAWLPLEEESHGTRTLFDLGPTVLDVLERGSVLLVDELESSLHPLLALQLLRQFNDPRTNPHNAQLLFTTHDTTLLGTLTGEPALRRDQVWLTEKDDDGATVLYPLTDYKPRKAENLERGYLQGRYGAIPFLDDLVRIEE